MQLTADEIWHYYLGAPIQLFFIDGKGTRTDLILGPDIKNGQLPQLDTWDIGTLNSFPVFLHLFNKTFKEFL